MSFILPLINFLPLGSDADSAYLQMGSSAPLPTEPPDRLGFVELHRWSQLVAPPEQLHLHPQPGEVLSVLVRQYRRSILGH